MFSTDPASAHDSAHDTDRQTPRQGDALLLPLHQRIVMQYVGMDGDTDGAVRELRLYHGAKEISFDEPELFAFAERLAGQSRFIAGDAAHWAPGIGWARVQPLLAQLLDEGVLRRADDAAPDEEDTLRGGASPSPLPPASCPHAREWRDSEAITAELTGRAVEPGWLELVLPIFRVAHMALDAEGRQVGEANVFPPAMRIEVPTSWRRCIYAGTRYLSERPMNVSALKAMRQHWPQMMAALRVVRAAYLRRFPDAVNGWTVGHLERLSTAALALPTYALMREHAAVANGQLHPALSSLFRVTDGLRMTMHQMLFIPIGEPTLAPDAPMTAREVYAYAERNHAFHSEHGVCAGPQSMIEEFLAVLIDGQPPRAGEPATIDTAVQSALDDIERALDYALLGLQAYAVTFSFWPAMVRAYERLALAAPAGEVRERLAAQVLHARHSTFLANEAWRVDRDRVYADMWARCGQGLGDEPVRLAACFEAHLDAHIDAHVDAQHGTVESDLLRRLQSRFDSRGIEVAAFAAALADFCAQAQAILRCASATQARINDLLGRPQPQRAFSAADLDVHNALQGAAPRRLPFLFDEIEALLGLHIEVDRDAIRIGTDQDDAAQAQACALQHSPGMVPGEPRALAHAHNPGEIT